MTKLSVMQESILRRLGTVGEFINEDSEYVVGLYVGGVHVCGLQFNPSGDACCVLTEGESSHYIATVTEIVEGLDALILDSGIICGISQLRRELMSERIGFKNLSRISLTIRRGGKVSVLYSPSTGKFRIEGIENCRHSTFPLLQTTRILTSYVAGAINHVTGDTLVYLLAKGLEDYDDINIGCADSEEECVVSVGDTTLLRAKRTDVDMVWCITPIGAVTHSLSIVETTNLIMAEYKKTMDAMKNEEVLHAAREVSLLVLMDTLTKRGDKVNVINPTSLRFSTSVTKGKISVTGKDQYDLSDLVAYHSNGTAKYRGVRAVSLSDLMMYLTKVERGAGVPIVNLFGLTPKNGGPFGIGNHPSTNPFAHTIQQHENATNGYTSELVSEVFLKSTKALQGRDMPESLVAGCVVGILSGLATHPDESLQFAGAASDTLSLSRPLFVYVIDYLHLLSTDTIEYLSGLARYGLDGLDGHDVLDTVSKEAVLNRVLDLLNSIDV